MDSVPPRSAASSSDGVFFGSRKGIDASNNRKLISKSKMKGEMMVKWLADKQSTNKKINFIFRSNRSKNFVKLSDSSIKTVMVP